MVVALQVPSASTRDRLWAVAAAAAAAAPFLLLVTHNKSTGYSSELVASFPPHPAAPEKEFCVSRDSWCKGQNAACRLFIVRRPLSSTKTASYHSSHERTMTSPHYRRTGHSIYLHVCVFQFEIHDDAVWFWLAYEAEWKRKGNKE